MRCKQHNTTTTEVGACQELLTFDVENRLLKAEVERLTARVKELEDTLKRAIEFAETGWGGNAERLIMGKPKEETK